jgi:hypothetical protein
MSRILTTAAFFVSILFAPWMLTVLIGIILLSAWRERSLLIIGGAMADALFGVPVPALGGFAFIYTALFALLIITELFLRKSMID